MDRSLRLSRVTFLSYSRCQWHFTLVMHCTTMVVVTENITALIKSFEKGTLRYLQRLIFITSKIIYDFIHHPVSYNTRHSLRSRACLSVWAHHHFVLLFSAHQITAEMQITTRGDWALSPGQSSGVPASLQSVLDDSFHEGCPLYGRGNNAGELIRLRRLHYSDYSLNSQKHSWGRDKHLNGQSQSYLKGDILPWLCGGFIH